MWLWVWVGVEATQRIGKKDSAASSPYLVYRSRAAHEFPRLIGNHRTSTPKVAHKFSRYSLLPSNISFLFLFFFVIYFHFLFHSPRCCNNGIFDDRTPRPVVSYPVNTIKTSRLSIFASVYILYVFTYIYICVCIHYITLRFAVIYTYTPTFTRIIIKINRKGSKPGDNGDGKRTARSSIRDRQDMKNMKNKSIIFFGTLTSRKKNRRRSVNANRVMSHFLFLALSPPSLTTIIRLFVPIKRLSTKLTFCVFR